MTMKRHFLPQGIAIAMTKQQFCFATGCSPYKLRNLLQKNADKYARIGYNKYDKLLMPIVVDQLLSDTRLRISQDYYIQYIRGQKGYEYVFSSENTDAYPSLNTK